MLNPGDRYLNLTQTGESRWWSWAVALWFTIVGWIIGQSILAGPIPTLSQKIDPELSIQFQIASEALFANHYKTHNILLFRGLIITTILSIFFWMINRATRDMPQKLFGVLTGIMMAGSAISLGFIMPNMSSPELNAIMNKMIGLSAWNYLLILATFPTALFGLYLCQKFIHKRSILSLHTAAKRFRWARLVQAMLITFIVYASLSIIGHISGLSTVKFSFDSTRFLQFALVSLLFIPLQSATEEILVRGYLNQGLVSLFKNKWVVYILTSLFFMSLHLANPEATSAASESSVIFYITMSSYFLFGFILCLVVDFDGGLESAIGIHAANNLFAAILVNYEGSALPTPSVFLAKINPMIDLPIGIATLALVTLIIYKTRRPLDAGSAPLKQLKKT